MSTDSTAGAIAPFDFHGQQVRTIADAQGDPWFVASDVAKILGYRDAEKMTRRLDGEDRGTRSVGTPGGEQQMTVISEAGLYAAILGSKVPGARDFKRWVTHDVLPTIRRHGGYLTDAKIEQALTDPDTIIELATQLKAARAEATREATARVAMESYARGLEPAADSWHALADANGDYAVRDAAQTLSRDHGITIGATRLWRQLRAWRWIGEDNRPYQQYVDRGLLRQMARSYEHPRTGERVPAKRPQLRITAKGLHEIRVRLSPTTNELSLGI